MSDREPNDGASVPSTSPAAGQPASRRWLIPLLASLTLGLAPFSPEPHLLGKLRWVAGGGDGMQLMDVFDLFWHGWPWVWLGFEAVVGLRGLVGAQR